MGSAGGAFHGNMFVRGLVLQLAREVSSLLPLEHVYLQLRYEQLLVKKLARFLEFQSCDL